MTKEKKERSEDGVPALKDIPILGWLFKRDAKKDEMDDLLIFITPHILKERKYKTNQNLPAEPKLPAESSNKPEAIPK